MSTSTEPTVLDFKPAVLAQQLTVVEWELFSKIEPADIIKTGRDPQEDDTISAVVRTTNKIATWAVGMIVEEASVEKRARLIERFINIADACRDLSNLSTLSALVSGLNSPPVTRLKQTWAHVGQEQIEALSKCNGIIHSAIVSGKYEEMHRSIKPPCVPFIGAYLMLVRQPPSDTRPSDDEILQEIKKWQSTPYRLERDERVAKFLHEQLGKYHSKEDGFLDASRQVELHAEG